MANRKPREKDAIDQLLDNFDLHGMTQDEIAGSNGLAKQLTSRLYERALQAEMDAHPGYEKNSNAGDHSGNSRNGYTGKTVIDDENNEGKKEVLGLWLAENEGAKFWTCIRVSG